jgi:hypothetical protein
MPCSLENLHRTSFVEVCKCSSLYGSVSRELKREATATSEKPMPEPTYLFAIFGASASCFWKLLSCLPLQQAWTLVERPPLRRSICPLTESWGVE